MRLSTFLYLLLAFPLLVAPMETIAQHPDSSLLAHAFSNARALYFARSAENSLLYTGSEYVVSDYGIKGSRFFLSPNPQNGTVFYQGELYENVPLYYDIYLDRLITHRYEQSFRIWLPEDKLGYFIIGEHYFVRLRPDSLYTNNPEEGFYELLYSGSSAVYLKRKMKIDEKVTSDGTTTQFVASDYFLVRKGKLFFKVRGKKALLRVFEDRKKELKKFARKNKLDFTDDPAAALAKVVAYYDQLNK